MKKRKRGKVDSDYSDVPAIPYTANGTSKDDLYATEVVSNAPNFYSGMGPFETNLDIINRKKRRCKSIDAKQMGGMLTSNSTNFGPQRVISQDVGLRQHPHKENAMLNELIVATLMKFTPLKELARNKLVCRTWNIEAIEFIKGKYVVEIVDEGTRRSVAAFIDSLKHSYMMPFRKFELRFEEQFPKKLPKSYRTFFFLFGGFVNHLSIGFLLDCEVNFSVHVLRNIFLMSVPNIISLAIDLPVATTSESSIFLRDKRIQFHRLKSILIQDFIDDNDNVIQESRERYSPGFMKDLLKAAPSLQKLSLFTESSILMARIVKSLETLKMNKTPLTQLHLDGIVSESDLHALTDYKFQLRAVRMRCLNSDVTKPTFENFLVAHKKTIEDLCIGDRCIYGRVGEDARRVNITFPPMEKLQVLKFIRRSCFSARQEGKYYLTTGLVQLPVLTKLVFDNDFPEPFHNLEDFFPRCGKKCFSLKELDFSCELSDPSILQDIAKEYPGISILRLTHAKSAFVKLISENMVNIETLCLYLPDFGRGKGYNIGSLCIQLDVKNCRKICVLRSPREGFWFTVIFKRPEVGLLKKIQKLEVETRSLRNCVHDVRVFTKFDELVELYFNRKLSFKYRRMLCTHLPKVRVIDENV